MRIILAGCTGFIGSRLVERLVHEEYHVVLLTRNPKKVSFTKSSFLEVVAWDGRTQGDWSSRVNGADAVINLSGESVAAKRWTSSQKVKLTSSRIESTQALVEAIKQAAKKPQVLINASASGYYGSVDEALVTEEHPKGAGFLSDLCLKWERTARQAETVGCRVCLLRIGVVLGKGGGVLQKFILPFKLFMGGPLGSGKQWFPWVHRDDVVGIAIFLLKNEMIQGPVNVVSPQPARMHDFCKTLGSVMHRPSWAPVPTFVLKILLGEMADIAVTGQKVLPKKLTEQGFVFRYPELKKALREILE